MKKSQLKQIIKEEIRKVLNEDETTSLSQFVEDNKDEIIKQLNKKEEEEEKAKTVDFVITYEENNKVYAERDYLPIGEKDGITSLDEISFSEVSGKHEIMVNGKKLKYSLYNI